ncbi:MAG: DNRLRE domain-containing protein [Acidobacteriota bacterium]|nr:MAG: DNRLRE domain-containing protein [Acidobacteriota bacterium]
MLPAPQERLLRPAPGRNDGTDQGSELGGKETYTLGSTPDTNFGTEIVAIGQPVSSCNQATGVAYLQFDVTALPKDKGRVFLGLTPYPHELSCRSNCLIDVYFYLIADPWDEMTVTFNHAPRLGAAVLGPFPIDMDSASQPEEFDITPIFEDWRWKRLPNYGLAIASPTVGCNEGSARFSFYTSDHPSIQKRPYLRMEDPKNRDHKHGTGKHDQPDGDS